MQVQDSMDENKFYQKNKRFTILVDFYSIFFIIEKEQNIC